jgi:hypothetical protein
MSRIAFSSLPEFRSLADSKRGPIVTSLTYSHSQRAGAHEAGGANDRTAVTLPRCRLQDCRLDYSYRQIPAFDDSVRGDPEYSVDAYLF